MRLLIALGILIFLTSCGTINEKANEEILGPYLVYGIGSSVDDAKNNAFRVAIEKAIGSAIISERSIEEANFIKKKIYSHSAGYVSNFEIISTKKQSDGSFKIEILVSVKKTALNDYILYSAKDSKSIKGDKASEAINNYLDERKKGDDYLDSVLNNYPNKAFDIRQKEFQLRLNDNRDFSLYIQYSIKMNLKYLKELSSAMKEVSDEKCSILGKIYDNDYFNGMPKFTINYLEDGSIIGDIFDYCFNDEIRPKKVFQKISNWRGNYDRGYAYGIEVNLLDFNKIVLDKFCVYDQPPPIGRRSDRPHYNLITGNWRIENSIVLDLNRATFSNRNVKYKDILKNLKTVELKIIDPKFCAN